MALLEYTKPLVRRHLHVYTMESRWTDEFRRVLSDGRRAFVHAGSIGVAAALVKLCVDAGVSYKLYTGKNHYDKKDFDDPDVAWDGVDVVIATATLTVAVDIKVWRCDSLFVHANPHGCVARDVLQGVL